HPAVTAAAITTSALRPKPLSAVGGFRWPPIGTASTTIRYASLRNKICARNPLHHTIIGSTYSNVGDGQEGLDTMPILSAENSFRKGLVALVEGDPATSATHFQSAILIERQHGVTRPQMRYLSYYGLSLAQSRSASPEAIQACETASRRDFFNPDL